MKQKPSSCQTKGSNVFKIQTYKHPKALKFGTDRKFLFSFTHTLITFYGLTDWSLSIQEMGDASLLIKSLFVFLREPFLCKELFSPEELWNGKLFHTLRQKACPDFSEMFGQQGAILHPASLMSIFLWNTCLPYLPFNLCRKGYLSEAEHMPCLEKITAHSLIARTNLDGKFGSDIARAIRSWLQVYE